MRDFSSEYLALLNGKFASLNLTRINSEEEFFDKQIHDSLLPVELFPLFNKELNKGLHLDIGFGGGFPLLPLAKSFPGTKFVGFEARRKKAEAVQQIAEELGLSNVKTHHCRIEELLIDRKCSISFKAVGKIQKFLKMINATEEVTVFFYKGPNLDELEPTPDKIGNFRKILKESYEAPGTNGRTFVVYKGKNVPRGTNKELVKLSQLN